MPAGFISCLVGYYRIAAEAGRVREINNTNATPILDRGVATLSRFDCTSCGAILAAVFKE